MEQTEILKRLYDESFSSAYRIFLELLDSRIQTMREKNDTCPQDDVKLNQGAIAELKALKVMLTKVSKKTPQYDGAFN